MSNLANDPLVILAMCVVLLIFVVCTGAWLDGKPARREAKRQAAQRRRERRADR